MLDDSFVSYNKLEFWESREGGMWPQICVWGITNKDKTPAEVSLPLCSNDDAFVIFFIVFPLSSDSLLVFE